jgi:hypothetical protein
LALYGVLNDVSYEYSFKLNNKAIIEKNIDIDFSIAKIFYKLKIFMFKLYYILEKILKMIP